MVVSLQGYVESEDGERDEDQDESNEQFLERSVKF
jgi:hypothetical protein